MKKMEIFVNIENVQYRIVYDENFLDQTLSVLGINSQKSFKYIKKAILYFATGQKNARCIYDLIANEHGLSSATVVSHIRNALVTSEFNGNLKNIDDVLGLEVYDYDYGFTNKSFIALICDYMINNNLLTTSVIK